MESKKYNKLVVTGGKEEATREGWGGGRHKLLVSDRLKDVLYNTGNMDNIL